MKNYQLNCTLLDQSNLLKFLHSDYNVDKWILYFNRYIRLTINLKNLLSKIDVAKQLPLPI